MKICTWVVLLASLTLAFTGCSKQSPTPAATYSTTDLGVVEVSDGVPLQRDLGNGMTCHITATILKDDSIVLDMTVVQAGKVLQRPRIQTRSGMAVMFAENNINFSLTPKIKQ